MNTPNDDLLKLILAKISETKKPIPPTKQVLDIIKKPLLDTADMRILFQKSARSIQRWREKKKVDFVMVGGAYYYLWGDVMKLLKPKE